jgi:purine nucleosidase
VTTPRRVLLDTDLAMGAPGSDIDDGFALALAVADPDVDLELVTTVGGNTDVATATRLSAELLERLGRPDIPVVRGAGGHPRAHAAVEIAERVLEAPGEVTLVAIGPLTNVALALRLAPDMAGALRELVIMGGVYLGTTGIAAMPGEFNIWCDPEAADVVFTSGAPLRCVGLDVTTRVRLTDDDAARMAAGGRPFGAFAGACTREWIAHWDRTNPGATDAHGSCALHDPLAVAAVTRPELLTWRPSRVAVETQGRHTRGVTVADLGTVENPPAPNCEIAVDVDVEGFREHVVTRLAGL